MHILHQAMPQHTHTHTYMEWFSCKVCCMVAFFFVKCWCVCWAHTHHIGILFIACVSMWANEYMLHSFQSCRSFNSHKHAQNNDLVRSFTMSICFLLFVYLYRVVLRVLQRIVDAQKKLTHKERSFFPWCFMLLHIYPFLPLNSHLSCFCFLHPLRRPHFKLSAFFVVIERNKRGTTNIPSKQQRHIRTTNLISG